MLAWSLVSQIQESIPLSELFLSLQSFPPFSLKTVRYREGLCVSWPLGKWLVQVMVLCCCLHLHWPPENCTLFHLVARHPAGICRMLKSAADITHGQSQLDHELVDFLLTKLHTGPSWLCRYSDSLPCSPSNTGLECLFCGLCYGSL